jgi:type I restriction enzyme R subunit
MYEANYDVYEMLRYGAHVKPGVGEQYETVWLIDWKNPQDNHFVVVEEVTVLGQHTSSQSSCIDLVHDLSDDHEQSPHN